MKSLHFFDHASTTPCCPEAAEALEAFACADYGNPSSSHAIGTAPAQAIKTSREQMARLLGVSASQIIFTGSGTESDNFAVQGVALAALAQSIQRGARGLPPRIISSQVEHAAVRQSVESLKSLGLDVQWAPVDGEGRVLPEALRPLLTPETILVSIQTVNNVLGTVQPIRELASSVRAHAPQAIFHSDAVQALGKVRLPSLEDGVHLLSISAHKIEGPKGIGALVVLDATLLKDGRLRPLIWGGGQEQGLRSGTQSAGLVVAFEKALSRKIVRQESEINHARTLRAEFKRMLDPRITWNSPHTAVSPFVVNLDLRGLPAGAFAKLLEERGFCVSTGSACSSAAKLSDGDPVLTAIGRTGNRALGLRISFGQEHTLKDIHALSQALTVCFDEIARVFPPEVVT